MAEGYRGEGWKRTGPTGMVCVWWWECIGNEIMWELMDGGADRRHFPSSFTTQPNNPTKCHSRFPPCQAHGCTTRQCFPWDFLVLLLRESLGGKRAHAIFPSPSQNILIYTDSLEALEEHNAHTERETLLPTCTHIPCCIHIQS